MKDDARTVRIDLMIISAALILSSIMIFIGFKQISNSINENAFGSSFSVPSPIVTIDINNKDFLTDDEASQYLGISWETVITLVKNGSYTGSYVKETINNLNEVYIFPREELKNWFSEYIKTNKTIRPDSRLLPEKE